MPDEKPRRTGDDHLDQRLDDLAEHLRKPHHDEEERQRHRDAAKRSGANPRREGKGRHGPGE